MIPMMHNAGLLGSFYAERSGEKICEMPIHANHIEIQIIFEDTNLNPKPAISSHSCNIQRP